MDYILAKFPSKTYIRNGNRYHAKGFDAVWQEVCKEEFRGYKLLCSAEYPNVAQITLQTPEGDPIIEAFFQIEWITEVK